MTGKLVSGVNMNKVSLAKFMPNKCVRVILKTVSFAKVFSGNFVWQCKRLTSANSFFYRFHNLVLKYTIPLTNSLSHHLHGHCFRYHSGKVSVAKKSWHASFPANSFAIEKIDDFVKVNCAKETFLL